MSNNIRTVRGNGNATGRAKGNATGRAKGNAIKVNTTSKFSVVDLANVEHPKVEHPKVEHISKKIDDEVEPVQEDETKSLNNEDLVHLKGLLARVPVPGNVFSNDVIEKIREAFEFVAIEDCSDTVLYCFKLCDLKAEDANKEEFYLVKVGKSESGRKKDYTATAGALVRFGEHQKDLGDVFERKLHIFTKKADLKQKEEDNTKKAMQALMSELSVKHIRKSTADEFQDFCCLINGTNEKKLKKSLAAPANIRELQTLAEDFAWTEVRLMSVKDFKSRRGAFFEKTNPEMSLGKFCCGLTRPARGTANFVFQVNGEVANVKM